LEIAWIALTKADIDQKGKKDYRFDRHKYAILGQTALCLSWAEDASALLFRYWENAHNNTTKEKLNTFAQGAFLLWYLLISPKLPGFKYHDSSIMI
jgi:hypothetical protein